jgi:transposase
MAGVPPKKITDAKVRVLRQTRTLNLRAPKVRDPLFLQKDFFDPRDLAQVKYEMLRRVQKEGAHVNETATAFGFSRPSFYKAQEDFTREGLAGLIPRKRGPKKRRKLTTDVMAAVVQAQVQEPTLTIAALLHMIQEKFALKINRRTLERALLAVKKKPQ